tara:strand:- start:3162 stop:3437 length:276 start_codon:yes stop_codon:yes gene_type:complete
VPQLKRENMKKVQVNKLGKAFSIFGGKGNVWSGTAHAYKAGYGNLCGTPALSSNHAAMAGITEVGCPQCLESLAAFGVANIETAPDLMQMK